MFEKSNELLKKMFDRYPSKTKTIVLHNINGLDIPFDPAWKNIGISLSGGADSCSLCFILATIIKNNNFDCKIHVITFLRCWNTRPWQDPIAIDVFNKLKSMFPDIIVDRHVGYIPPELEWGVSGALFSKGNAAGKNKLDGTKSGDMIFGGSFYNYVSYKNKLEAVFNATSKNPKDVELQTHHDRAPNREKDPEDGVLGDLIHTQSNDTRWAITPYRFVQKDWIVAQYHMFNILDLYSTTRSCEGDLEEPDIKEQFPNIDNYSPGKYIPLCNVCFWCLERKWAEDNFEEVIKKLNE